MKLYHLSVYWEEYEDKSEEYIGVFSSIKNREKARVRFWKECLSNSSSPFEDVKKWHEVETNYNEWAKIHRPQDVLDRIELFVEWETELDQISFIDPTD